MPKYLIQGAYGADGARGLMKDGGSKRRTVMDLAAAKQVGYKAPGS
jgi:hypothetical protein